MEKQTLSIPIDRHAFSQAKKSNPQLQLLIQAHAGTQYALFDKHSEQPFQWIQIKRKGNDLEVRLTEESRYEADLPADMVIKNFFSTDHVAFLGGTAATNETPTSLETLGEYSATSAKTGLQITDLTTFSDSLMIGSRVVMASMAGVAGIATQTEQGPNADTASSGKGQTSVGNTDSAQSNHESPPSKLSMGAWGGQLLAPIQVEGNWYYVWDRNNDGHIDTADRMTIDALELLFFGMPTGITEIHRTPTSSPIEGRTIKLPTAGQIALINPWSLLPDSNPSDSANDTAPPLSLWVEGENHQTYWSATLMTQGHAAVVLPSTQVNDLADTNAAVLAFQVI